MLHTGAALLRLGSGINRCLILSAIWDPYANIFFLPSEVGCFVLQHSGWISCLSRPSPSFPSFFFNVYRAVISWFMEQMDNLRFTHLVEKAGSLLVIFIWYVGQGQVGMCWLKSRDDLVCRSIRVWPLFRSIQAFLYFQFETWNQVIKNFSFFYFKTHFKLLKNIYWKKSFSRSLYFIMDSNVIASDDGFIHLFAASCRNTACVGSVDCIVSSTYLERDKTERAV